MKRIIKFFVSLTYKIKNIGKCKFNAFSNVVLRNCSFEGENILGEKNWLSHTEVGFCSYIGTGCEFSNTKIGRYCSIGSYIRVVSADHPLDMVSTFPAFYSGTYHTRYVKDSKFKEHITTNNGYECEIGNDVWIGDNVLIRGGVKIGDGAVIGMGSIVLHDVSPYSIVAGVPAKAIKQRFDDITIRSLLQIKWWKKPEKWLRENAENFVSPKRLINITNNETEEK